MGELVRQSARRISAILVEAGVVNEAQVEQALTHQRDSGLRLGEALVALGHATEEDIGWALARQFGVPFVDVVADSADPDLVRAFDEALLRRLHALPLLKTSDGLTVALTDPTDAAGLAELEQAADMPVVPSLASRSAIEAVLNAVFGSRGTRQGAAAPRTEMIDDRSGARVLHFQVEQALAAGATEIHFIPRDGSLHVHHRVGDRIVLAATVRYNMLYALLARLEAIGGPTIEGDDDHAHGRAVCPMGDRDVWLDVSLLAVNDGVAVTLGLRAAGRKAVALEALGFEHVDLARIREALDQPSGIVLVSGPPRSGCSTTLASFLGGMAADERRSLAFERTTGTPMPAGLRLALPPERSRAIWEQVAVGQNADVVALDDVLTGYAIGGVLSSALSGRLLLATTDWSDTFDMIDFLLEQPQGRAVLARRLRLVVQQRLLRPSCETMPKYTSRRPPVYEVLLVNDAMRRGIRDGESGRTLRALAAGDGFRTLDEEVRRRVETGEVTAVEATRVLG